MLKGLWCGRSSAEVEPRVLPCLSAGHEPYRITDRLWLGVYLPRFSLEVLCRGSDISKPSIVVVGQESRLQVWSCNTQAEACGLHPGMALSAAHALVPHLWVLKRQEDVESDALKGVAAWAGQFTSLVSLMPLQGLLLEVGGSLSLFGGLGRLWTRISDGLAELGYTAHLAIAPTPQGAWLLARAGFKQPVTDTHALPDCLDSVPLECMGLPEETVKDLRDLGLRCFGDCCRLPRDGLARRIGPDAIKLLDRALGKASDPREPYIIPPVFERRLTLSFEVWDVEALLFAVHRLLLELTGSLAARSGGIRRLELVLHHGGYTVTRVPIELVGPSRDSRHLLELLQERLERLELPAAVEHVEIKARDIEPLPPQNLDLFDEAEQERESWQCLIERLRTRLGSEAVQGLCMVSEHRPEWVWRYCLPGEKAKVMEYPPRPLWLLEKPRILKTVESKPSLGGVLTLRRGSERIESGWWDGLDVARDYFVAENPGGQRFWIFRDLRNERHWYVHGIFA